MLYFGRNRRRGTTKLFRAGGLNSEKWTAAICLFKLISIKAEKRRRRGVQQSVSSKIVFLATLLSQRCCKIPVWKMSGCLFLGHTRSRLKFWKLPRPSKSRPTRIGEIIASHRREVIYPAAFLGVASKLFWIYAAAHEYNGIYFMKPPLNLTKGFLSTSGLFNRTLL